MTSKLVVNTIEADTGISSVSFASSISMDSTSKFHFSAAGVDIGADTNINRPASGVLGFNINSSEKARIDSSGRVMIGTATEGQATADDLTIATSGTTGMTIRSGTGNDGNIYFSDGTSGSDEFRGYIQYGHSNNSMVFGTNSIERLRIDSTGDVKFCGTNLTNNTNKNVNLTAPSYSTSEEDVNLVQVENESSQNSLSFGGGTSALNSATVIRFLTSSAVNTVTGTERLRIDSSGRVLIGTTTEGVSTADDLTVANSGHGGITIRTGTSSLGNLYFSDGTSGDDEYRGVVQYDHSGDFMRFLTNATERFRIASTGAIGLSGTNYGSSGQVLTSQGSGSPVQWATPSSITTAGGTMTLGFQDHVSGNVSSTTPTAYYQRIGNMVFCSVDTGAINLSGLNNGEILLVTGCFPVTRDNNWDMCGSAYQYTVNSGQNGGGPVIVPTMGYWLSNTSLYFVIPRNNSTADNMTVGMCNSNNTRIFMQWSYKVN